MHVFIAAPLFNEQQINVIREVEETCARYGHLYYSARLHSGSAELTEEQRRDYSCWIPVFMNNLNALYWAQLCIAVLTWELPPEESLFLCRNSGGVWQPIKHVQIPDTGTVWEIGFLYARGVPIYGYYPQREAAKLNLMLTHSLTGVVVGQQELEELLRDPWSAKTRVPSSLVI